MLNRRWWVDPEEQAFLRKIRIENKIPLYLYLMSKNYAFMSHRSRLLIAEARPFEPEDFA